MKKWIWAVVAVALAALLVGAWFLYDNLKENFQPDTLADQPTKETEGTEAAADPGFAPDITVYDPQGKSVKLSDMRGKPVVLNLWASWCNPCKQEMPGFQSASEKYDSQVQFMMVNLTGQDKREDAQAFLTEAGYTFPVYFDTDNSAAMNYSTGSIPTTIFIDKDGHLVTYAIGAISEEILEKGIGMIME